MLFGADWEAMFLPHTPLLEIFVRGTVTYLALYLLLRFVRRNTGALSVNDLVVLVLIADAAQNAMADDYRSITDGVLLVAVIIGWSHMLNWLGYRIPLVQKLVYPSKVAIVRDGVADADVMRRYNVTDEELTSQLRLQGIHRIEEVERAYVEGNGQLSVLTSETDDARGQRPDRLREIEY